MHHMNFANLLDLALPIFYKYVFAHSPKFYATNISRYMAMQNHYIDMALPTTNEDNEYNKHTIYSCSGRWTHCWVFKYQLATNSCSWFVYLIIIIPQNLNETRYLFGH